MSTQISWIIADASGNILRSGNSPTMAEVVLQAKAGETALTLDAYESLFDERNYTVNLTTGVMTSTPSAPGGGGQTREGDFATIE